MVKARPASTFEVIEPDLVLEVLIVTLDAPAQLRNTHELADRGVRWQRDEIVLRRAGFRGWPLAEQPFLRAGRSPLMAMSGANASHREPRRLLTASPLTPR